jgi:hypothetical protein
MQTRPLGTVTGLCVFCLWHAVAYAAVLVWCESAAAQSLAPSAVTNAADEAAKGPIDIGSRKQLFIDDRFFASVKNVALRMNPAAKMGPVLLPDKPWESMDIGYCVSVAEDGDQYKMWYLARDRQGTCRQCYAQSKDGRAWEKPSLGLIDYNGSKDNNIVLAPTEKQVEMPISVFLDPAGTPEARFKAVAFMYWPDPKRLGLYVHTSPDGIHWKLSDRRIFPLPGDMPNQAFYDSRLKKYVAYLRVWAPLRKIGRIETSDLTQPWPADQTVPPSCRDWTGNTITVEGHVIPIVFSYDQLDPNPSDHYNAACVQYPWADDAYFMFPSPYRHYPEPPLSKYANDGLVDIQTATSRDGVHWNRLSREPYVSLGTEEEIDRGQIYMAVGMFRRGGKIEQYYGGYRTNHGVLGSQPDADGAIFRLEQRLDGFVSADAAFEGGEFATPPLVFSGTKLVLNINASAMGTCKVEILDDQGNVLPGYSLAECDEIGGNHVEKTVSWKGQSHLSSLRGQVVRLRVVMRACKLFAFEFR